MTAILVIVAYITIGMCLLPMMARWELAGLKASPNTYLLGYDAWVRKMSEEQLIRVAGMRALLWALGWPVAYMRLFATRGLMQDHKQTLAAKAAEEVIEENRRIIRAYDHAQRVAFDKALNDTPASKGGWITP